MPPPSIDLHANPRYALAGKIVTMNDAREVLKGTVYIEGAKIVAVRDEGAPPPAGFEACPVLPTGGTIYPGLIELHNHLAYNILELWDVPKKYSNREQWRGSPDYKRLISGPLRLIKDVPGYLEAIVRYAECKCLFGGVTASQGITLVNGNRIQALFHGIVRNVETPADKTLPAVHPRVGDLKLPEVENFYRTLCTTYKDRCYLIHLAEGKDDFARKHFEALRRENGEWAITDSLAGIHSAGLQEEHKDWEILAKGGGAMVWSPLSNLLLYGDTAEVENAKKAHVRIGIGSDWSPSGSKNLLGELKVAYLESHRRGDVFTPAELLAMATIDAAKILRWQDKLGSIEPGKYADLLVLHQSQGDPYKHLLNANELSVKLVVIGGVPRYGTKAMMQPFGEGTEDLSLAGTPRRLDLRDKDSDQVVGRLTLKEARERLEKGLSSLPNPPSFGGPIGGGLDPESTWSLVLEEDQDMGMSQRPLAPISAAAITDIATADATPDAEVVKPVALDKLTVIEDPERFFGRLEKQRNLPKEIAKGLRKLYNLHDEHH